MTPQPPPDLTGLFALLRRVRRRLRWQAALTGAVLGALAGAAGLLAGVLCARAGVLPARSPRLFLLAAAAGLLLGGLARAWRRIPLWYVASRIDHTHDLHDRLGSALAFLPGAPAPADGEGPGAALRDLAIRDALGAVPKVERARAAPWQRPPHLLPLCALALLCAGAALLRLPGRAPAPPPAAPAQPSLHLVVDPELIAPEREEVARLLALAQENGDEELAALAREMQRLLDQAERGELTRKEAFDRLAELEQKLMQARDGTLEELRERLRKAGDELGQDKLARELGQALKKEDLEKARQELMRLSRLAQQRARDAARAEQQRQDKAALAESLRRAADASQGKDQWKGQGDAEQRTQKEQALREEERRLKKQLQEHPQDEESARRLKKVQRELERLEREKQEREEARRELERLQRDMQQAAEEMQKQLSQMTPEQRKALEQLARDMGRMQDEIRKLQQQKNGQGQGQGQAMVTLGSIKQVLRRVARSSIGPGQGNGQGSGQGVAQGDGQGQGGQNGQNGKGGQGQGQGQGKNKSAMKDFLDRASGKGGGDSDVLVEGDGQGKGDQQMMILGEGNTPVLLPGLGQQQQQQGQGQGGPRPTGDGIGTEHDPNLLGGPTRLDSKRRQTRVTGREGAGPTRSETILGAAERGFSSQQYKNNVYLPYTAGMEEAMSKERVPPGYRFYVKRYFQLIKPRE